MYKHNNEERFRFFFIRKVQLRICQNNKHKKMFTCEVPNSEDEILI